MRISLSYCKHNSNEYDGWEKVLLMTTDKTNQQWNLYPSNQVCQRTYQDVQVGRCKRNEDSYASNDMSWIGWGIQQSGQLSIQSYDWIFTISNCIQTWLLFSVGLCARFQQDPREVHLTTFKWIFRYLIGTSNLGLYFKYSKEFRLISYCDVDYASNKIKRRSTNGSCHIIGWNLVTWISKKQGLIVLSTIEVEYISVESCCTQLIWIKNQLEGYNIYEENIPIYYDIWQSII